MEVSELLEKIDIVAYIQQFCDLEKKNGEWWGLSPLKEEKTPSFSVNEEKQRFYDFSSGAYGNVIDFVEHYNHCSFPRAMEILKKYANVTDDININTIRLESAKIAKRYRGNFATPKTSNATIIPDDYMKRYEKREDKLLVWEEEGISKESLDRFCVYYDSFSDRLVYPIRDLDGRIVNVGGRTLDPQWKEKGLRKYNYFFSWGSINTIYGIAENLSEIKEMNEVILFEGCKSVLLADTWGIRNCGAILTCHLSPNQMKILAKLGVRVVFALDAEVNIRKDANIQKLKRYVRVDWVKNYNNLLAEKMSPVDAGFETWKKLYESRKQLN